MDGASQMVRVADAHTIKLVSTTSGAVIDLPSGGGSNAHSLPREGMDLRTRSGAQGIHIDMTVADTGRLSDSAANP